MDWLEQADPHHLRNPACIVAVTLVDLLRVQERLHMTGLNAHDWQVGFRQTIDQPLRQRTCLDPNPRILDTDRGQQNRNVIRLARNRAFANDLANFINDANRRLLH